MSRVLDEDVLGDDLMSGLPTVSRFRFQLCAIDTLALPEYAGSAVRGMLGWGLRRTVCVTGKSTCTDCRLTDSCPYFGFFEQSGEGGGEGRAGHAAPHPYLLQINTGSPSTIAPGETYDVGLTTFGSARDVLPYLVVGLSRAGQRGLGPANAKFDLERVEQEQHLGRGDWITIATGESTRIQSRDTLWPAPRAIGRFARLEFVTPFRIKRAGRLVGPDEFRLRHLLDALRYRIADLQRLYGKKHPAHAWVSSLPPAPEAALTRSELAWKDWTRYSSRQRTRMQMGGLTGELWLDTEALGNWAGLIGLGQWLHVGKATTMGLGGYRFGEAPSL